MAKVLNPLGGVAASGTAGGLTYQNWRGIAVVRKKPTPAQPRTERQLKMRSIVTQLARYWRNNLTPGLRQAWEEFSRIFTWQDVFGRELQLSGISLFIKMNAVLLDAGKTLQNTPPPNLTPSEVANYLLVVDEGLIQNISVDGTVYQGVFQIPLKWNYPSDDEIQSQGTFVDIWVAGQVIQATQSDIVFKPLPPGRKAGKSDFRHAIYRPDVTGQDPPTAEINVDLYPVTSGATVNVTILLRRYNKYGRYSGVVKIEQLVNIP